MSTPDTTRRIDLRAFLDDLTETLRRHGLAGDRPVTGLSVGFRGWQRLWSGLPDSTAIEFTPTSADVKVFDGRETRRVRVEAE